MPADLLATGLARRLFHGHDHEICQPRGQAEPARESAFDLQVLVDDLDEVPPVHAREVQRSFSEIRKGYVSPRTRARGAARFSEIRKDVSPRTRA